MQGISPLIASVLLIAIAVIIAGMLANWGPTLTQSQTKTISNKTAQIVECNPPVIEDVYLDFQANVSRVFVRGSQGMAVVDEAKVISITGEEAPLVNSSAVPFNLSSGKLKILEFNITNKIKICSNFSQAVITSCLTDKFTSAPKCTG